MTTLDSSAIASLCSQVGIPADAIPTAVAIALAESGGNPTAHNPVPPDNSYGLWQINMLAHTKKELGISKNEDLFDPSTNARAMAKISSRGTNWKPWTTYTSGKYRFFLSGATATPVATSTGVQTIAEKVTSPNFWSRIGEYALGFLLILIGLVLLAGIGKIKQVTKVVRTVSKVAA